MNQTTSTLSECEKCGGSGWILEIVDNEEIARPCECYKKRLQNNKIRFANIPATYRNVRLSDFKTDIYKEEKYNNMAKIVKNAVNMYLSEIDKNIQSGFGIYLYSKTKGSGKTLLATAIANELIHKYNMTTKFATSLDILSEIRATWDKNNNQDQELSTEYKLMNYLKTTEVLVIDDFGVEKHQEWHNDRFYEIVNTRYLNRLITIYTSNSAINQLAYDKRITNRIIERSYIMRLPEKSIREELSDQLQTKLKEVIQHGTTDD